MSIRQANILAVEGGMGFCRRWLWSLALALAFFGVSLAFPGQMAAWGQSLAWAGALPPAPAAKTPITDGDMIGLAMHGKPRFTTTAPASLPEADPNARKGGTLRQIIVGQFDSLNPYSIKGTVGMGAWALNETLMKRSWDEPFSLYCLICKTVALAPDRRSIAFTLRPEARFHDGAPITSADIAFSLAILREKGKPAQRRSYSFVRHIETPSPFYIRFWLDDTADREQALLLGLMPILPKHYWQNKDLSAISHTPPLGSGPYRLVKSDMGRQLIYERDPHYWGAELWVNKGYYNFDTLIYDYYRDQDVALEAFNAGEADWWREASPARWQSQLTGPAFTQGVLIKQAFDQKRPAAMRGFFLNSRRPIFADRRVREALNAAFDFDWINKSFLGGQNKRIESWFANTPLAAQGPPSAGELALLKPWQGELSAAVFADAPRPRQIDGLGNRGRRENLRYADLLLQAAGWVLKDGRRQNSQGKALEFEIILNASQHSEEKLALEWGRGLARLGVRASVTSLESGLYQNRLREFDFDVMVGQILSTLSPGSEQLLYHGSEAADNPGSRNYVGLKIPAIDALALAVANAESLQALQTATKALDRVLRSEWGVVSWGYTPKDYLAFRANLRYPQPIPLYGTVIETWWQEAPSP
jgi:microcin C transport system substrate-binding protein